MPGGRVLAEGRGAVGLVLVGGVVGTRGAAEGRGADGAAEMSGAVAVGAVAVDGAGVLFFATCAVAVDGAGVLSVADGIDARGAFATRSRPAPPLDGVSATSLGTELR